MDTTKEIGYIHTYLHVFCNEKETKFKNKYENKL